MIRVLLVDDHPLVRSGLRSLVDTADGLIVVGEAASGEEAVERSDLLHPEVVLMDLSMPGIGGLSATRQISARHSDVRIIVLTSFHDPVSVQQALQAGAVGYLLKDADPATVIAGVRAAADGGAPLDPRAARVLLPGGAAGHPALPALPAPPAPPVPPALQPRIVVGREAEVLSLLAQGLANKRIAHDLGISERTVKAHVGSVFRRIGVSDRTSAALWARDNGY